MKKSNLLLWVIVLAFSLRIFFVIYYVDLENVNCWEYGEIAKNVINGNGYSLFYIDDNNLEYLYSPKTNPFVSAYMPPGYVFTILPFLLIESEIYAKLAIIIFQIFLSLVVIIILYKLVAEIFDERTAIVASIVYAILPEFIFSVSSVTPTIIFHLLITIILLKLFRQEKYNRIDCFIPILIAILIYFRVEFIMYFIILTFYLLIKKKFKIVLIYFSLVFLLLLPWSIRNYITFEQVVPLTTSSGINLFRGNNSIEIGSWGNDNIHNEVMSLPRNDNFEIYPNTMFCERALDFIVSHPVEFVKNIFIKNFELLVFSIYDSRTSNLIYLLPWILILLLSIVGFIARYDFKKYKYLIFIFVYFSIVSSIFFALPRYQTMMKVAIIPFAAVGIIALYEKFKITETNKE